jgi:hypothetical protein
MTDHPRIEWGVYYATEFWRGPMTEQEAREWVAGWEEDGGRPGAFYVVSRPVGEWTRENGEHADD